MIRTTDVPILTHETHLNHLLHHDFFGISHTTVDRGGNLRTISRQESQDLQGVTPIQPLFDAVGNTISSPPGGCPLDQGGTTAERFGTEPGILARISWEIGNWTDIPGVRPVGILRAAAELRLAAPRCPSRPSCRLARRSPRPTGRRCPYLPVHQADQCLLKEAGEPESCAGPPISRGTTSSGFTGACGSRRRWRPA